MILPSSANPQLGKDSYPHDFKNRPQKFSQSHQMGFRHPRILRIFQSSYRPAPRSSTNARYEQHRDLPGREESSGAKLSLTESSLLSRVMWLQPTATSQDMRRKKMMMKFLILTGGMERCILETLEAVIRSFRDLLSGDGIFIRQKCLDRE